jgi:hypothetical protein
MMETNLKVPFSQIMRKAVLHVTVQMTGVRLFAIRRAVGVMLIKAAAVAFGCGIEITIKVRP